jgi:hypothetical protein
MEVILYFVCPIVLVRSKRLGAAHRQRKEVLWDMNTRRRKQESSAELASCYATWHKYLGLQRNSLSSSFLSLTLFFFVNLYLKDHIPSKCYRADYSM